MLANIKFKLVAFEVGLFYAWKEAFGDVPAVDVVDGDIMEQEGDAIVSPANSFGYMDGGLDLKYSQRFGWHLEDAVRKELEQKHHGEIPVGSALVVPTSNARIPFLISAPTMRVPSDISKTINAYLAFKAIIEAITEFNHVEHRISTVLCPGLGTGEGRLSYSDCARQMRAAYDVCIKGGSFNRGGLASAARHHMFLLGDTRGT